MNPIMDPDPAAPQQFGGRTLTFRHDLHQQSMFDDEALAARLDVYPREELGVFTMGEDPEAWRTWRAGDAGALSGAQLLEAARRGRLWLNLRHLERHIDA